MGSSNVKDFLDKGVTFETNNGLFSSVNIKYAPEFENPEEKDGKKKLSPISIAAAKKYQGKL